MVLALNLSGSVSLASSFNHLALESNTKVNESE